MAPRRPRPRELGFYVRGRINRGLSRVLNRRRAVTPPRPLDDVLRSAHSARDRIALLEGRTNAERERAVAAYLDAREIGFGGQRFSTFEGSGENFVVDVGESERTLVLIAHHDAVPGSPGANDNAAAVAVLFDLLDELRAAPPSRVRVRFLFTAEEERGYLGARAFVERARLADIVGVLSLELCGIGDSVALWDAGEHSGFLAQSARALEGRGFRHDETYHVVGRIPIFGSDHRAFALAGIPAYGLSVVPLANADALRRFVMSPVRTALMHMVSRPAPFDTYHTGRDSGATIDVSALTLTGRALRAIVDSF